jgi:cullin 1
MAEPI